MSQASVSKALNGSAEISEETRRKVLKIATEKGYFEQKKKAKRVEGRHYRPYIAIVVPEIISLNYAAEATMLVRALDAMKLDGRIYISGFGADGYHRTLQEILRNEYVDGVISFYDIPPERPMKLPFVCITQFDVDLPCNLVSSSLKEGIRAAVRHLTTLGHERIGFIGERNTLPKERLFVEVMTELGLDSSFLYSNEHRFERCGYGGILKMLDSEHIFPTALLCAYDEIAYGAINELKLYGYSVPQDFSVVGMNDVVFSNLMEPELTSIVIHSDTLCEEAIRLLCDAIRGESDRCRHIEVPCDLAVRKTTSSSRSELII